MAVFVRAAAQHAGGARGGWGMGMGSAGAGGWRKDGGASPLCNIARHPARSARARVVEVEDVHRWCWPCCGRGEPRRAHRSAPPAARCTTAGETNVWSPHLFPHRSVAVPRIEEQILAILYLDQMLSIVVSLPALVAHSPLPATRGFTVTHAVPTLSRADPAMIVVPPVVQHGRSAPWQCNLELSSCASSGRAWRFWAAQHHAHGAQPLPQVLELAAPSKRGFLFPPPLTLQAVRGAILGGAAVGLVKTNPDPNTDPNTKPSPSPSPSPSSSPYP